MNASPIRECLARIAPEPGNLIRGLRTLQSAFGYVSDEAVRETADYFGVAPAEVEAVLEFYPRFQRVKPGRFRISVCDGTACRRKGSPQILEWLRDELGIGVGETDAEGRFSLEKVSCLGRCGHAPVMSINGMVYDRLDRQKTIRILKEHRGR